MGVDVSDEKLAAMLRRYVALVEPLLEDPEAWLGVAPVRSPVPAGGVPDAAPAGDPPSRSRQAARILGRGMLGPTPPTSPEWASFSPQRRAAWWVTRIRTLAGVAAAAPRAAGMLADRLPLQEALGAAASGLAVCAVAREFGRQDRASWVPLLAQVLFARELSPDAGLEPDVEPETQPGSAPTDPTDRRGRPTPGPTRTGRPVGRSGPCGGSPACSAPSPRCSTSVRAAA